MTLDQFIVDKSRRGWQIVSRDENGVQMRKPKKWNVAGLVLGAVLLVVYGAGLVVLILVTLDYAAQSERVAYVTAAQLAADDAPREFRDSSTAWDAVLWVLVIIPAALFIIGFIIYQLVRLFN